MPMIQIGPAQWMDAALAKAKRIPIYRAAPKVTPKPALRQSVKTPARHVSPAPAEKHPRDILDAMRLGKTNDEIHHLIRRGVIHRPESLEGAAREWGDANLLREAQRRGLI